MSTVVYANGVMVADTQATLGNEPIFGVRKIGRTENYLFGFTGRICQIMPYYHFVEAMDKQGNPPEYWYQFGDELPDLGDNVDVIIVNRSDHIYVLGAKGAMSPMLRPFEAVGSGGDFALGALGHGADAYEALGVAMDFDVATGGNPMSISFRDPITRPAPYNNA